MTEPQKAFLLSLAQNNARADMIANAFQRRFGAFITPLDVQTFIEAWKRKQENQRHADNIRSQLPTHDAELRWARDRLRQELERDDLSPHQLVELAGEYRKNIVSSQDIASMSAQNGQMQFVLFYGDAPVASEDGKVVDVEAQ